MTHPVDAAPIAYNKHLSRTCWVCSLRTASAQVQPGAQLAITGSGFPPTRQPRSNLGWSGTFVNSVLSLSYIQWSPPLPTPPNTSNIQLSGVSGSTGYVLIRRRRAPPTHSESPSATPSRARLPLRVCRSQRMERPPSWASALDGPSNVLQTVSADPVGNIAAPNFPIPLSTTPGPHTLMAVVGGTEDASTTIYVAGQGGQPFIQVVYNGQPIANSTSTAPGRVLEGQTLTVSGFGYPAGDTVAVTLNGSGPTLGSSSVQQDSSFLIPFVVSLPLGDQTLVAATQGLIPPNVQASAPIDVQSIQ